MSQSNETLVFVLIILILFSGLFSATEIAYSSSNKIRLKNMDNDDISGASTALKILDDFDNFLTATLIGNNIVNIGDVEYAILETNGEVTVIQKPNKRNSIPEDFNIMPDYEGIPYDLVIDGVIMEENLKKIGKNYIWLERQVEKFNMKPKDALVVTLDGKGQIFCQKKEEKGN